MKTKRKAAKPSDATYTAKDIQAAKAIIKKFGLATATSSRRVVGDVEPYLLTTMF